jgi:hypothetical protein
MTQSQESVFNSKCKFSRQKWHRNFILEMKIRDYRLSISARVETWTEGHNIKNTLTKIHTINNKLKKQSLNKPVSSFRL